MVRGMKTALSNDIEEWIPVCLLPNLELQKSIERAGMAFVPVDDARITRLASDHPNFRKFIRRFSDQFGVPIKPTVVVVHENAKFNTHLAEVVRGFRDVLAISAIAYSYALQTIYPGRPRAKFSDVFSIYPWRIDQKFEYLVAQTPAQFSLHVVEEFRGQTSPELYRTQLAEVDFDLKLRDVLLAEWEVRALFRALSMANEAARIPGSAELTIYDLGRSVALWVSAFEILAHPGKGKSGFTQVCDLLDRTKWFSQKVGKKRFVVRLGRSGKPIRRTVASKIYAHLYDARNKFLHGNPVTISSLRLPTSRRLVWLFAAPLFRIALTSFLEVYPKRQVGGLGTTELSAEVVKYMEFSGAQRSYEEALLFAFRPDDDSNVND